MRNSRASVCIAAFIAAISMVMMSHGEASPFAAPQPTAAKTTAGEARPTSSHKAGAVPEGDKPLSNVPDLLPGGMCPEPGPAGAAAMSAAASARIPLKIGLTLSNIWKGSPDDYEHECLDQIVKIDSRSISVTSSCPVGDDHKPLVTTRRTCWSDFMDSHLYMTGSAKTYPETLVGSLKFNLSLASFAALKGRGQFNHRFIAMEADLPGFSRFDVEGTMISDGPSTYKLIVNDKAIEVPTIEANYVNHKTNDIIRIKVLDEPRFPIVLDYYSPSMRSFFISYTKVSFPTANEVEKHLATDRHTDVYGIYFNFASDELRSESEPVLHEIADAMQAHPDWKLVINGHTDNIGGDALNLDLSRRRAAAVRKELVGGYKVDGSRLTINGFGASQPKESNDSERGRALNRRVELVRP